MPNADPTEPARPIVVPNSTVPTQINTVLRDLAIVIAAIPGLMAVLGTRDVLQIISYIQSIEFAPALAVLAGFAVILWRWINAGRTVKKMQAMEIYTPADVAVRKGRDV